MKPQLTLDKFRGKRFQFHINTGVAIFKIVHVVEGRIKLDFDVYLSSIGVNLQRPLVWSLLQKQQLILSILKGQKLPPITLVESELPGREKVFKVIDGKQRLSTLVAFCQNEFPIEVDGIEYLCSELPQNLQNEILWYYPVADVGYEYINEPISDADKIRWFELINFAGTPQDAEHMANLKSQSNT